LVPTSRRVGTNDPNVGLLETETETEEGDSVTSSGADRSVRCARPVFGGRATDRTSVWLSSLCLRVSVVVRIYFFFATLRLCLPAVLRTALQAGVRSPVLLLNRRTWFGSYKRENYRPAAGPLLIPVSLPRIEHRVSSIPSFPFDLARGVVRGFGPR